MTELPGSEPRLPRSTLSRMETKRFLNPSSLLLTLEYLLCIPIIYLNEDFFFQKQDAFEGKPRYVTYDVHHLGDGKRDMGTGVWKIDLF